MPPSEERRVAAEVVELGQTLFDAVLEAATRPAADAEPFPETELREAADTFFRALRRLLGIDHHSDANKAK